MPQDSRLVLGLPFYPDDSRLCGPASLAAVMNYMGFPVTLEEVANGVQRWELRGSIGPDLVIWARSKGAKARFYSAKPEDLVEFVNKQIPVVVQVDEGVGPVVMGHFMVVAGYTFDGVVVNTGLVQQELMDWGKFLTQWYKMGNFTIVVEARDFPELSSGTVQPGAAPAAPGSPAPADSPPGAAEGSPAPASPGGAAGGSPAPASPGGAAGESPDPASPGGPAGDALMMTEPGQAAPAARPDAASPTGGAARPEASAPGQRAVPPLPEPPGGGVSEALADDYGAPEIRPGGGGF
jgi:predicted double-glycine peptidase